MIEIKSHVVGGEGPARDTATSVGISGNGADIAFEAVSIIKSLMHRLKVIDPDLHSLVLAQIALDKDILSGAEGEDTERMEAEMSRLMSKGIIGKEGIN